MTFVTGLVERGMDVPWRSLVRFILLRFCITGLVSAGVGVG
jgi:hypothetical protein